LEQDVRAQRGKELTEKPEAIASGFLFVLIVQKCNTLKEDLRSKSTVLLHYYLLPITSKILNANFSEK
jgi:hypothetical protein